MCSRFEYKGPLSRIGRAFARNVESYSIAQVSRTFVAFLWYMDISFSATSLCKSDEQFPVNNCTCFVVKRPANSVTWYEAMEHCSRDSTTLASVESSEENDVLREHLNSGGNWNYWIGLKAEANSSFLLPDGEKAPFVSPEVRKTPNTLQRCISVRSTNIWKARSCDESHRFICKYVKHEKSNLASTRLL